MRPADEAPPDEDGADRPDLNIDRPEASNPMGSASSSDLDESAVRALIDRARAGDEEAFGEVVRAHYGRVYSVIYRMVSHAEDARELTQVAWVKAWQRLASFKGDARFSTWMYRLAVNTATDHLRQRGRRREVEFVEADADEQELRENLRAGHLGRPDRTLQAREIQTAFDEALATLSPEHRAALWLREVEGLSYREIAAATRSRIGTVMSRIFYARKALQTRLGAYR